MSSWSSARPWFSLTWYWLVGFPEGFHWFLGCGQWAWPGRDHRFLVGDDGFVDGWLGQHSVAHPTGTYVFELGYKMTDMREDQDHEMNHVLR